MYIERNRRIAFVDIDLSGHHISYLTTLCRAVDHYILIVPERVAELPIERQRFITDTKGLHNHPYRYMRWLNQVKKIVQAENINTIHFLYGDAFARYFGIGLRKFKQYKTIATFHQIRRNFIKDISFRLIMRHLDLGVVHTAYLLKQFKHLGIQNLYQIEYPCFLQFGDLSQKDVKDRLMIPNNQVVIGFVGLISDYKGLDLLTESLRKIEMPFHLLVAGENIAYSDAELKKMIHGLENRSTTLFRHLTNIEYATCILASDIIVLPYKKSFNGASGPLTEAVFNGKIVLGANHGSLGDIIQDNHIGYTFNTNDVDDLVRVIDQTLSKTFRMDNKYVDYRRKLNLDIFVEQYQRIYQEI